MERLVLWLSTDVKRKCEELISFFKKSNSYFVFIVLTTLLSKPEVWLLLFRLNHSDCMVWSFSIHGRKVSHKTNDSQTVFVYRIVP